MMTLVLLPGMDGTGELFSALVAALEPERHVIVVRYPVSDAMDYNQLEAVARSALPPDTPYILLGESFSGPIAVSIAASAPGQLKGLILSCTFVRNPRPLFARLRFFVSKLPISLAPLGLVSHLLLGKFSTINLRAEITQAISQVSVSALRARLKAVLAVDVSAKLDQITVPILYLRATHDRVVPRAASELISRLSSGTRVVELDAPHFLLQAVSAKAAKQIVAFMRELETAH
jgi:pimeloyl-ACP methyl ester carboxylesterase